MAITGHYIIYLKIIESMFANNIAFNVSVVIITYYLDVFDYL